MDEEKNIEEGQEEHGIDPGSGVPIPERDISLREQIFEYAITNADSRHHEPVAHLCEHWEKTNNEFFGGLLLPAVIEFDEPGSTTSYGECSTDSGFGVSNKIQIRPSILDGTLQELRGGSKDPEGLMRFAEHVLLHETIHQWAFECVPREAVLAESKNYNGHGPIFSTKANEIGEKLGYPPVRSHNKKSHSGKTRDLPNPSQWPHNVCPPEYYLGAYIPTSWDIPEGLKKTVGALIEEYGEDHIRFMVVLMKAHGYGKVWRAIEELYPTEK